jgi:hypothetical protein
MSLKITNLAYQNPGACEHLKITVDIDGDVHVIPWAQHEDELLEMAKEIRRSIGLPAGQEEEALLILWSIVMSKIRGKTKTEIEGFDIDAV